MLRSHDLNLEHPDITAALRTGYPSYYEGHHRIYCGECGRSLDESEVYEDQYHEFLCRDCLLMLHEKD